MKWYEASGLVAAVCLSFALIHSLMVTGAVKTLATRLLGERIVRSFYRLFYSIVSVITVAVAVYLIARIPDARLLEPPLWARLLGHAVQAAGVVLGLLAFRRFRTDEFLGIAQARRFFRGEKAGGDLEGLTSEGLVTTGVYGIVRHPLYLAGILIFTFSPNVTRNWLIVTVLADAYFVLGAFLEDRRLVERFGARYVRYMQSVPGLIPRPRLRQARK